MRFVVPDHLLDRGQDDARSVCSVNAQPERPSANELHDRLLAEIGEHVDGATQANKSR